jgi:hypothetical protein
MCRSAHCWKGCVYLLLGLPLGARARWCRLVSTGLVSLAVALLQHNKQFETSAYTSFGVGRYLSKHALVERVCLPAAGPAAGDPREVMSPSEQ